MKYLIGLFLLSVSISVWGQRNVLYNPTCMKRLKYNATSSYGNQDYIVYSVQLNDYEQLFFEVGKESDNYQSRVSGSVMTCKTSSMKRDLIQQINNGAKFNIVRKEKDLRISPISSAYYLKINNSGFEYFGSEFGFEFNSFEANKNIDLALNGSSARVFYAGERDFQCVKAFTFKIISNFSGTDYEMTIVPDVGVIATTSKIQSVGNKQLLNINATNLQAYFSDFCGSSSYDPYEEDIVVDNSNTSRGGYDVSDRTSTNTATNTVTNPVVNDPNSKYGTIISHSRSTNSNTAGINTRTSAVNTTSTATNMTANPQVHIVQSKETLYRIAMNYGLTVEELRALNGLTSNTIYPGDQLYVSNTVANTNDAYNRDVFNSRGNTTTTSTAPARMTSREEAPAWINTSGVHFVRRGEKVVDIAQKYGFTERRFRYINGLNATEELPAGYRLKTTDCELDPSMNKTFATKSSGTTFNFDEDKTTTNTNTGTTYASAPTDGAFIYGSSNSNPTAISTGLEIKKAVHIVRESETLYSIARRYSTTIERLAIINNIDPNEVLLPNQRLVIE